MLLKPFLLILGIVVLLAGLVCHAGLAATRTTSLSVTATVAAGCQIFPASGAAAGAQSGKSNWNTPISMSCSLPVAYQVIVSSLPPADHPQSDLVTSGYAHDYDLDLSGVQDRSNNLAVESRYDPVRFVSFSLTQVHAEAMPCIANDDGSKIMSVTIIY